MSAKKMIPKFRKKRSNSKYSSSDNIATPFKESAASQSKRAILYMCNFMYVVVQYSASPKKVLFEDLFQILAFASVLEKY